MIKGNSPDRLGKQAKLASLRLYSLNPALDHKKRSGNQDQNNFKNSFEQQIKSCYVLATFTLIKYRKFG